MMNEILEKSVSSLNLSGKLGNLLTPARLPMSRQITSIFWLTLRPEFSVRGVNGMRTSLQIQITIPRSLDEQKYSGLATREQRPNLHYDIVDPSTGGKFPLIHLLVGDTLLIE